MLPKDTLKVVLKRGLDEYLAGIDFIVKYTEIGCDIYNVKVPDGHVVVEYHIDSCMCQRKQIRGTIVGGILKLDD